MFNGPFIPHQSAKSLTPSVRTSVTEHMARTPVFAPSRHIMAQQAILSSATDEFILIGFHPSMLCN